MNNQNNITKPLQKFVFCITLRLLKGNKTIKPLKYNKYYITMLLFLLLQ